MEREIKGKYSLGAKLAITNDVFKSLGEKEKNPLLPKIAIIEDMYSRGISAKELPLVIPADIKEIIYHKNTDENISRVMYKCKTKLSDKCVTVSEGSLFASSDKQEIEKVVSLCSIQKASYISGVIRSRIKELTERFRPKHLANIVVPLKFKLSSVIIPENDFFIAESLDDSKEVNTGNYTVRLKEDGTVQVTFNVIVLLDGVCYRLVIDRDKNVKKIYSSLSKTSQTF